MSDRFEIVHTDAGWHARFRAANGRVVWTTESYSRRRTAASAITTFGKGPLHRTVVPGVYVNGEWVEVRDVDERTEATR
ncbi:DUF1508 domain-containing protein [Nocardioides panaciterrulae]|uniref:Uncharacterized protein YegP (UPF0339 family) n=1 Tax=Nocardioides panaciterrulae TaxID=661492 RepID=A0A7Y9EAE7_9ACTN|nr:uncharacterized protein YegP (UPF0339 family) [Nocardioides panaciterrulae]NYD43967.1 uncharacterized protein YegP (UPF0339 family) [Nocardioides panaciterrulae]